MKNYLLLLSLAVMILASCKDDEPEIDPIVGVWELQEVEIPSAPQGYVYLTYSSNTSSLFGEVFYEIEFKADFTYERELRFGDGSRESDSGEWEIDSDELYLDQDETTFDLLFTEFTISEEITNESMFLVGETDTWPALTTSFVESFNANIDTITSDASYFAIINANVVAQPISITMEFEKE